MKQNANLIRPGQVIEYEGQRWTVLKIQLMTGNKTNARWRTADTVERLQTEEKEYQYLYGDDDLLTLMDPSSYEQTSIPRGLLGDAAPFLQENMTLVVDLIEGDPVAVHLPTTVTLEIVEADPVVKGQTASSSYKPAKLSNGVKVMVPPFIEAGEKIVVRTEDSTYVERVR
jgi:elongation factor P